MVFARLYFLSLIAVLAFLFPGDAVSQTTLADATTSGGCSTAVTRGLSQQLIDQLNCNWPGLMVSYEDDSNIILNDGAVFPYLQASAASALRAAARRRSGSIRINSGLRTIAQQLMLYRWGALGRCGISAVAPPGRSNHNGGLAIDIADYSYWQNSLEREDFRWYGPGDAVHFDFVGSGTVDVRQLSVLAFQQLYNLNNADKLVEDGLYGINTENALLSSPVEGFPIGASCITAPPPVADPECTTSDGLEGTCVSTSLCSHPKQSYAGFCPGPADVQCCANPTCTVSSYHTGVCKDVSGCSTKAFPGYCPGPANVQCCTTIEGPSKRSPLAASRGSSNAMNQAGLDLIASFEGWFPNFYIDPVGIRTIGYGHACHVFDCNNLMALSGSTWRRVTAPLTLSEGEDLLNGDLEAGGYKDCVSDAVSATLNDDQFSALVSFTFNVGCGGFRSSTLLRRVNEGASDELIRDAMLMWVKGGGAVLPGLVRRRNAEADLYTLGGASTGSASVCYKDGLEGLCVASGSCSGPSDASACAGADESCCLSVPCSVAGGSSGSCISTNACGGTTHPGLCPGPASIQCCIAPECSLSTGIQGSCIHVDACGGTPESGLCPGPNEIRCCPPSCTLSQGGEGQCISTTQCDGSPQAGLCPGPSNVQCCPLSGLRRDTHGHRNASRAHTKHSTRDAQEYQVAVCPPGTQWNEEKSYCFDGAEDVAYGPFSREELELCEDTASAAMCEQRESVVVKDVRIRLPRMRRADLESMRTSKCPLGTSEDQRVLGRCYGIERDSDGIDRQVVFAGFNELDHSACVDAGGGAACSTSKWGAGFYRAVQSTADNLLTATADEANEEIDPSLVNYMSESGNEYIEAMKAIGKDLEDSPASSPEMPLQWAWDILFPTARVE